jgi:hypothetical protein
MPSYDEFLKQKELHWVVLGCEWMGLHLSFHVNLAHGMTHKEYKLAQGFNLDTGVIAKPLAEKYGERPHQGIALCEGS